MLKDLHEKRGKKTQTLPITSDVIKFTGKLLASLISVHKLKTPEDLSTFKKLTESAIALTILLNRKRVRDVHQTGF